MITGLDHVQVAAPPGREDDARRFYCGLLGLEEIPKPEALRARGGIWFRLGEHELHVGVDRDFAPARKAHPGIRVSDEAALATLADRLTAAGHPVEWADPSEIPGRDRFHVHDPFGNRLEVLSPAAPALYGELAPWFHLLTAPADYAEEAALYAGLIREEVPDAWTLLELGAGGGNNASHLKAEFTCVLTDLSPAMLDVSHGLNPECEHVEGDMRTLRLGRTFDAVLVHDAVMYLTSEDDLAAAAATAFEHLRPGGVALFVPDCTAETFFEHTSRGGHDGDDGRRLRYLEWTYDPDPADTLFATEFAVLISEPGQETRVVHERHVEGLFPGETWLRVLGAAGFSASEAKGAEGDEPGEVSTVFVCVRPGATPA